MRAEEPQLGPCPDDELLAAFIEKRIPADTRARLERHVAACPTCLDVVAAALPVAVEATWANGPAERSALGPSTGTRASARPRWRVWAVAAGLLLALGGLALGVREGAMGTRVAPLLARLGTRLLGTPLQARAITVRLGDTASTFVVTLHQVEIGPTSGRFAHADELTATVALAAPLAGEPVIAVFRALRPQWNLDRAPLATASSRAARAELLALLGRAGRIEVVEGSVRLPGPPGRELALEGLTGGVERVEGGARVALQGRLGDGDIDVAGTVTGDDHDLSITVGGRGLDAARLPVVGTRLDGMADLRLDVTSRGDQLRIDGRLAVREGRLLGRGPATLLRLGADTRTALASVAPALAGDDLPFDDARAVFGWRDGTWRLPRIFVTTGEVMAGGRVRMDARGEVSGRGTLRMPPELVAALQPQVPLVTGFRDETGAATLPFAVSGSWAAPQLTLRRP